MATPEPPPPPIPYAFAAVGDIGWFVTFDPPDPAETLPVAGWGTFAHEDGGAIEPMVPDGPRGVLVAARDLGVVVNLEWREGGA